MILVLNINIGFTQIHKKVLFLGNSYTYVNDLPSLIDSIATANNDTLQKDQNTIGGYTMQDHSTNTTSLSKISSHDWDFVVIQGQSQQPSFPPSQVASDVYPYAKILSDSVTANNQCSEVLFFMTWGRQNGDQANCPYYTPICTYEGMQERLRESYLEMGIDNNASVSPVGIAWKKTREVTCDTINLYSSDSSHPSIYGSYLAACVFYASIFDKSPVGNTFISTLPQSTAGLLQNIANDVVFDSSYVWNFQTANFGWEIVSGLNYHFIGTENADTDFWDFGDGTTDVSHNPIHIFPGVGLYQVKHIISNNCVNDTIIKEIYIGTNNVLEIKNKFNLYPNPSNGKFKIEMTENNVFVTVTDITGKTVFAENVTSDSWIDLTNQPKGTYLVQIKSENGLRNEKIIIE